jgi:urease accessory protein
MFRTRSSRSEGRIISINLTLMIWFSPSFPVGAFAYSHGLEQAQELGLVTNANELEAWLRVLITHGSLTADLALIEKTYAGEEVNALALALSPSSERYLETTQQGNSFIKNIQNAYPHDKFSPPAGDVAYPIAVALAAIAYDIPLEDLKRVYALAFISNLMSASIRLGIIGQTAAQKLIKSLLPLIETAPSSLYTCGFMADFVSLKHETQYTRIFRS